MAMRLKFDVKVHRQKTGCGLVRSFAEILSDLLGCAEIVSRNLSTNRIYIKKLKVE